MNKPLKIMLWGEEIGRLMWDNHRRTTYFTYNPSWARKGINVSPLCAPINPATLVMPIWAEQERIYQHLPAFLADSLPDAWGSQLFELWRQHNDLQKADITPLEKLAFIGKRGMGALEFEPELSKSLSKDKIDIQSLVSLAQRIFMERENAKIEPAESLTLQSLIAVGTSAGGRQPKAILAIHHNTGEIRSGQIAGLKDYDYCILKFGDPQYCSAELEMTYYEMATKAGINMMPSCLREIEGRRHFQTLRFDRIGEEKIHTQTLAAINPEANSYEELISTCRRLQLPDCDCIEVFRRMVFNHLANNTDDHNKNFAFTMDRHGRWRLSPAYDITYIIDARGFQPNLEHCIYTCAKLRDITLHDVLQFAANNGIRNPERIIKDVVEAISQFRDIAQRNHVSPEWLGRVETCLRQHIAAWGFADNIASYNFTTQNGATVQNARLEQAYKGNIHLLAYINGAERKFIIRQNTDLRRILTATGLSRIGGERIRQLVETHFT